jgi:hypothetical protein
MDERPARLDEAVVQAVVTNAHGDLDAVRTLVDAQPSLANACWDWGGGDWETALGAAAHTGSRDVAEYLIERGAHVDVFAAAMLGETAVVRAMLDAFPQLTDATGPHGIPLRVHAEIGGAHEVIALLDAHAASAASS